MKKHDEGYVLPYVMVILTVLALVAAYLMTGSLRNLQSQQASIQRMEEQYAAEGEIEKVVAELSLEEDSFTCIAENIPTGTSVSLDDRGTPEDSGDDITLGADAITFTLVAESGSVRIEAEITVTGETISHNVVTKPTFAYTSYTITTVSAEGGADDAT